MVPTKHVVIDLANQDVGPTYPAKILRRKSVEALHSQRFRHTQDNPTVVLAVIHSGVLTMTYLFDGGHSKHLSNLITYAF